MLGINHDKLNLLIVSLMLLSMGLLTACSSGAAEAANQEGLRTWLLVTAPEKPLPANKPVSVRSRTEDKTHQISHVELYVQEWPAPPQKTFQDQLLLIRSDAAPFAQTTWTVSQVFTPTQPGHYVIMVVGYNRLGQRTESSHLGFDVE